jgi:hypothetical protein
MQNYTIPRLYYTVHQNYTEKAVTASISHLQLRATTAASRWNPCKDVWFSFVGYKGAKCAGWPYTATKRT